VRPTWESLSRLVILSGTACSEESGCGRFAQLYVILSVCEESVATISTVLSRVETPTSRFSNAPRSDMVGRCNLSLRAERSEAWQSRL